MMKTTAQRRRSEKNTVLVSRKPSVMWWSALIGAGALFALQVILSARVATNGEEIKQLQLTQASLEIDNKELRREIALLGAMTRVESIATNELKMVKAYNDVMYIPANPAGLIASN